MSRIATVHTQLELRLVVPGGPSLPVLAGMHYASADPWAVRVAFRTGGHSSADSSDGSDASSADSSVDSSETTVEWLFARQLLTDGVRTTAGEGDVRVWPSESGRERVVNLAMASPSGSALFEIDRDALVEFLQQTYLAVPTGAEDEVVDLDAELALLFS